MQKIRDWWDDLDWQVQFWAQAVGGIISALVIIFMLSAWLEAAHCNDMKQLYGNAQRIEYTLPTGCMLQLKSGYWVDVDKAQYIEIGE